MAIAQDARAISDVEKAIKKHDSALEKATKAQEKADEAAAQANRADKELRWVASHPDLPDDFDLDEFRRSLEEPFEDEVEHLSQEDEDDIVEAVKDAQSEDDDIDDDDPFDD